jgi:phage gp37-like protein
MSDTSPIKLIETALVSTLKAGMPEVLVESYGGQLDDENSEWLRRLPCVWITFERTNGVKRVGPRKFRSKVRFQIMAAQRLLGPEPSGRLGGLGEVGVYELLDEHVKRLVTDNKLGLAIDPIEPKGLSMVMQGYFGNDAVAVMAMAIESGYVETIADPEVVGEFNSLGIKYFLQPGDDMADAADEVTLQP